MGNSPSRHQLAKRASANLASTQNKLSQKRTNGKSVLGTLLAPTLPMFLTNNPLPNGYPWSTLDTTTNYYEHYPHTGVIRTYNFTVTRGKIAPDGYERDVLLVNDAFPGPPIEVNWGDTIQVTLNNQITGPEEGVALHWHGFLQSDTPWADGVPAVTQCPVAPGKSFTYSFVAELYGSTWYHSHYSAQYAGGLIGAITVHGPNKYKYDTDLGPVLVTDWYHDDYFTLVEQTMSVGGGPVRADNNLINGKGNFDCSTKKEGDDTPCTNNAGISKFRFKRGKTHRLRLINAGADTLQRISIDGHKMRVIANDFIPVEAYETEVVTLGIGQRTDVLVTANGDGDAFYMRANTSTKCSLSNQPLGFAAIYYDGADESKAPDSKPWDAPDPGTCLNDDLALTKPLVPIKVPHADKVMKMDINTFVNETGHRLWNFDSDIDFRGNYNSPTLLLSKLGNHTFEKQWNVKNTGNAKSVRVIIQNRSGIAHPMHLHAFNMYLLHIGTGEWDGSTIVRPSNPQRRDVLMIPASGHAVMQFDAIKNPTLAPLHCHIAWHVSAGLFAQFLTNPDGVEKLKIPSIIAQTCRDWGTWTKTNIPNQIDSGL